MNKAFIMGFTAILVITLAVSISVFRLATTPTGQIISNVQDGEEWNIEITDEGFDPSFLYVKIGDKVTWINHASYPQTVTSEIWGSKLLVENESFSLIITEAQRTNYFSLVNESFRGTIMTVKQ